MKPNRETLRDLHARLSSSAQAHLESAIKKIVKSKESGKRVIAVTGSGPNIHEGVTTQIAELIHKGIIDGVITSSAVIAHEMSGTLDRVQRIQVDENIDSPCPAHLLPRGGTFEITWLSDAERRELQNEIGEGWEMYDRLLDRKANPVIKAAGNMAWPLGLRTERLAQDISHASSQYGVPLELFAGFGADPRTMIGAGAQKNVPVLVSVPQLVGGGSVGLAIGDTISVSRRSRMIADLLASADVIIESAIALSQEIHDGPFETYTGHGIWAAWDHLPTYSLAGKTLIRMDLDPNLERAWGLERQASDVQNAINSGLPKTKQTGIPFRMEMSGFSRLEGSIPLTGDIGSLWPLLVSAVADRLDVSLDFISAPQESEEGRRMREWIVADVNFIHRPQMYEEAARRLASDAVHTEQPLRAEPGLRTH